MGLRSGSNCFSAKGSTFMVVKIKSAAPIDPFASTQTKALNNMAAAANARKPKPDPKRKTTPEPKRSGTAKTNTNTDTKPGASAIAASRPLKPRAPATQPTLAQSEQRLSHYAKQYEQKADGKAGIQKLGDFFRKGITGYGDHQFKNIGESQKALASLKQQVRVGKLSQAQADSASRVVLKKFGAEEARVTKAQAQNAEIGKAVHGAGRVVVVSGSAAVATVAGGGVNVVAGTIAAAAAGSAYDAITVAAQGRSVIAPRLEAANSLGGVAMRAVQGKAVNRVDVTRAFTGTATDAVNGVFAGRGVITSKAAQLAAQQIAAQSGKQAGRFALGLASAKAGAVNTVWQTGAATGMQTLEIAGNTSLTHEQKKKMASENALKALSQLPGQLVTGGVSGHLGVSAQFKIKPVDALFQFALDGGTNVVQTSISNKINGKGFKLSQADLAAAFVQSGGGAIQNVAQRIPQRSAQEVLTHLGTMHPYEGTTLTKIPDHKKGTTVIVGEWPFGPHATETKAVVRTGAGTPNDPLIGTFHLWTDANALPVGAGAQQSGPLHVYRTFTQPLTGQRMAIKTNLNKLHAMGQRDQAVLDKLTQKAGLTASIPMKPLVDETPTHVLAPSKDDVAALSIMRLAAAGARGIGKVHTLTDLAVPGEWLGHFLAGSGTPKVMTEKQVEFMLDHMSVREWSDAHEELQTLQPVIAKLMAKGATKGKLECTASDTVKSATTEGGWYLALGSFHMSTAFKGTWEVGANGGVEFKGEKRYLVQDRYNWEAKEFNGQESTQPIARLPQVLVRSLPKSYLKAFLVPGNDTAHRGAVLVGKSDHPAQINDALFAQLQMVRGGAQPFWTFGLSAATAVKVTWLPGQL